MPEQPKVVFFSLNIGLKGVKGSRRANLRSPRPDPPRQCRNTWAADVFSLGQRRAMVPRMRAGPIHLAALLALTACRRESPTDKPVATASLPAVSATAAPPSPPAPPPRVDETQLRTEDERNTTAIFRAAAPSTVFVTQLRLVVDHFERVAAEVPAGSGSGFAWDDRGTIVTNFHVVQGARALNVTLNTDKTYPARLIGAEPRKDIAVIKIDVPPGTLAPLHVLDPKEVLQVGQKTIAIGNPFGLDHTLTTGVISALGRQVVGVGGVTIRDMIQRVSLVALGAAPQRPD
jgi:S1-C subfamily serine protease